MSETHIRQRGADSGDSGRPDRSYPPLPEPLEVGVYDNHTHLELADGEHPLSIREHLDRAALVGVQGVIQVGNDLATSRWSAEMAAIEPRMLAAVAIHPNDAPGLGEAGTLAEAVAEIAALAERPRVVAVGETGLDFFRTAEPDRHWQYRSFEEHIRIATERGLALQIHDRDAHAEVVATLKRVGAPERTVFHCFSGDREFAQLCAENGWYLSFAGTVTFRNAQPLREALVAVPRRLILVETDAPFLTPMPFRGRPNAPYLMPHTVRSMAETMGIEVSVLAAQLAANTEEVYGRWDAAPVTTPPRASPSGTAAASEPEDGR